MTMDPDTQRVYNEGEQYYQLVNSKGWRLVKEQVVTPQLLDLQSVQNIKHTGPTDMAREVYARQLAVDYVMEIIRSIEGRAQQHIDNAALTQDVQIVE